MKRLLLASASAMALGFAAGSALADGRVTITDAQPSTSPYNGTNGQGGAFTVTRAAPLANGDYNGEYGGNLFPSDGRGVGADSFLTFCIEVGDTLSFSGTYYSEISTSALRDGGVTPPNTNPDPLSPVTAKIYSEFRAIPSTNTTTVDTTGLFGGYLGSTLDPADTTAIQEAIWYAENEQGSISGLAQQIYNWAVGMNPRDLGCVRVLRLWDNYDAITGVYSGSHQDLLTCIPLPPSAYAGLATMAGLLGLGYIRRRNLAAA